MLTREEEAACNMVGGGEMFADIGGISVELVVLTEQYLQKTVSVPVIP